jgi:predicted O-methyltransferase YrrM
MTADVQWSPYDAELRVLTRLLANAPPGPAIEIGCYRGRTTAHLAAICAERDESLIAIDPWIDMGGDDTYARFVENTRAFRNLVVVRARSDEALPALPARRASFAFVDGDHSYEQTLRDLQNAYTCLALGGVLAVHDVFSPAHPGTGRAFAEFARGRPAHSFRYEPSAQEQQLHQNDRVCGLGWVFVS